MKALKGTKTHDNLKAAFAGESQANRRYLYFASKADVVMVFDVGLRGEVQVAAVGLRLAGERRLEIVVGLRAFERFHGSSLQIKWVLPIAPRDLLDGGFDLREGARHLAAGRHRDAELARDLRDREDAAHHGAMRRGRERASGRDL